MEYGQSSHVGGESVENGVTILLKYNGYWKRIRGTGRKKYECGKQKTLRVDYDKESYQDLCDTVMGIAPWIIGKVLKVYYAKLDTVPKAYGSVKDNNKFTNLLREHWVAKKRLELYVTARDADLYVMNLAPSFSSRRRSHLGGTTRIGAPKQFVVSDDDENTRSRYNADDKNDGADDGADYDFVGREAHAEKNVVFFDDLADDHQVGDKQLALNVYWSGRTNGY